MKARKLFALILSIVMMGAVALPAMAEGETIKIGGIAPLTGAYAQYGIAVKNGADLYISQLNAAGGINGMQVELAWEDDAANDAQAQSIYYQHLDAGCVAILGDVLTGQTRVVAQLAKEDGIPMVTASATAFDINEGIGNVFRTCFIDDFQGVVMANYAKQAGYTKVAILYGTDSAYSTGLVTAFEGQAATNGLEIVAKEGASFTDIDFKAQLTNIKSAAPEAIFLPWYGAEASLILSQAAEIGLTDVVYMGADGISDIVDKIDDKSLLTAVTYADHFAFDSDDEAVKGFIAAYNGMYGEDPTISFAATGYDAALVICEAIKNSGITDFSDAASAYAAITDCIKASKVEGVSGVITFDENNNPIKSAFIMTFNADGTKASVAKVDP